MLDSFGRTMGDSLLDDLGEYLLKDYMSEMKRMDIIDKRRALRFLMKRKPSQYAIRSWIDAYEYLTGYKDEYMYPDEVRIKLIEYLKS